MMYRKSPAEQEQIRRALLDATNPIANVSGVDLVRVALHTSNVLNDLQDDGFYDLIILQGKIAGLYDSLSATDLCYGLYLRGIYERRYSFIRADEAKVSLHCWNGSAHPSGNWFAMSGLYDGKRVQLTHEEVMRMN